MGSWLNNEVSDRSCRPSHVPRTKGCRELIGMHTWFLKEVCWTGSSAAREMLLSRMKKRIRLVKIESLTMRWHWRRNLHREERRREACQEGKESSSLGLPSSVQCAEGVHQLGEWVLRPEVLLRRVMAATAPHHEARLHRMLPSKALSLIASFDIL